MKRLVLFFLALAALVATVFIVLRDPVPVTASASEAARAPENTGGTAQRGAARSGESSVDARTTPAESTFPQADPRTPAWLLPDPIASSSNPDSPAATTSAAKLARLGVVMDKLTRLQSQTTIDAKEAVAAIAELEQINGSPVMNGIRLDVLRENVQVADQIQSAAKELQELKNLQASQVAVSPERSALIQSKTADLATLRSRIRHDIVQSPASGVTP